MTLKQVRAVSSKMPFPPYLEFVSRSVVLPLLQLGGLQCFFHLDLPLTFLRELHLDLCFQGTDYKISQSYNLVPWAGSLPQAP
jgi:hypothetical protein